MKNIELNNRKKYFWILQLSGWFAFGLIDSYIKWVDNLRQMEYIIGSMITYFTGIIVTSILHNYYKRIELRSVFYSFLKVLGFSIPATIVWIIIDHIFSIPIWGLRNIIFGYFALPWIEKFSSFFYNLLLIIAWSGLYFGIKYTLVLNIQNEKIEKTQLLLELSQLKVLRYQLNPHFLFNSLSSLRMLIRKDSKRAEQMLNKIAEFLRYSLTGKNNNEVPLSEELKALQHYLEIEKIRFEEKIDFKYNIDPLAEDYPIPIFLIHPLIENAIKYGMDTSKEKLQIDLNAKVKDKTLTIEVCNSGEWIEPDKNNNSIGMGLKNVQKRLDYAFPGNNSFSIDKSNGRVKITISVLREIGKE